MMSELQNYLIADAVYKIVYNIIFLYLFVRQILKIDRMGDNLEAQPSKTIWLKFFIIILIITLLLLHITLSFLDKNYWLYQLPFYSLVALIFVLNYTLQIYITLQFKKTKNRYLPSIIYWALNFVTALIQIIVVQQIITDSQITTIIQIILCLLDAALVIISIILEKPIASTASTVLLSSSMDRSIQNSNLTETERRPRFNQQLYIEFNRDFQITQNKEHSLICEFKIAVFFEDHVQIITKTDLQIQKLTQEMMKEFPMHAAGIFYVPNIRLDNLMRYGTAKQKQFQNLLIEITKTDEFYCPTLLEFLQIPNSARSKLMSSKLLPLQRKISSSSQENEDFVPFFNVSTHLKYFMISNPDILELLVTKPRKQIVEFHKRLIEDKHLDMEVLPQQPSEIDFIHFFDIVVNRKGLWRCFSRWFGLGSQIEEKIYNYFDVWKNGFEGLQIQMVGHEKSFDILGKIKTFYLLSLSFNTNPRPLIFKKRFSEFFNLHKEINKFMIKNKLKGDKLPEMPPKFSPFGSKTSPTSRLSRLNHYMKEVMRIEGINRCIKLLQFLQIGERKQANDAVVPKQTIPQESEPSYFHEFNNSQ